MPKGKFGSNFIKVIIIGILGVIFGRVHIAFTGTGVTASTWLISLLYILAVPAIISLVLVFLNGNAAHGASRDFTRNYLLGFFEIIIVLLILILSALFPNYTGVSFTDFSLTSPLGVITTLWPLAATIVAVCI